MEAFFVFRRYISHRLFDSLPLERKFLLEFMSGFVSFYGNLSFE